jgi:serine/threonine protein kinase
LAQPLTKAAANAIAGTSAFDVEGYRDYRGVLVVGAWAWVETAGLGITTEVDYVEVYRPLKLLRLIFWLLFGFLVLTAVGVLFSTEVIGKLKAKVSRAEDKMMKLGTYTLGKRLGEGGMGEVYRASHALLRRPTAIKLLSPDRSSEEMVQRFEREVQMTSQLSHPNTIGIFDYGRTPEGIFYYAMEYLDGINLEDLLEKFGPLPANRVSYILLQVCGSLAEAHSVGLVHRDIKPANIFLCHRGGMYDFAKVLDFGLVRVFGSDQKNATILTQVGMTTGTPAYMAPEMITGGEIGAEADVYAVGCVGYGLLTGELVFGGENAMAMALAHTKQKPKPPSTVVDADIPECMESLILKCLAKKPSDRFRNARELARELKKCEFELSWSSELAEQWWIENLSDRATKKIVRKG